ncbi:MAG: type II toxin-antitoxin system RelE family toxin [Streptosporangiaceae bacterium]
MALRAADHDAFRRATRAITALAEDPYPEGAVPWGGSGFYRLHAGDVRILYEVSEEAEALYVLNVGLVLRPR